MSTNSQHALKLGSSFAHLAENRRASSRFSSDPVEEHELESMLETAGFAPSGYNLQPWRFVVVRDSENRRKLCKAAMQQKKIEEAPVVIVAFARRDGWDEYIEEIFRASASRGAISDSELEKQQENAKKFISSLPIAVWLNRHVMIAFTHLMLAAEALGWDTAPMEGFDPKAVAACTKLPEDAEVVALLAIGRRKGDSPFPGRLPLEKFVHVESYGNPWRSQHAR